MNKSYPTEFPNMALQPDQGSFAQHFHVPEQHEPGPGLLPSQDYAIIGRELPNRNDEFENMVNNALPTRVTRNLSDDCTEELEHEENYPQITEKESESDGDRAEPTRKLSTGNIGKGAPVTHSAAHLTWDRAREDSSDIESDGEIRFQIKAVQVGAIAEKIQALADARKKSIRKCPRLSNKKMTHGMKMKTPLQTSQRSTTSIRRAWFCDLRKLQLKQPDFFTSREATLEDDSQMTKGKRAYASLPITQFNNADIQEIFLTEYDRKVRNGGSYSSFLQLVTVAGQFLRLHVVLGFTEVNQCHEPGSLYRAVCDREAVDLFLNYYDARGQCTTVMTKALHLRKIAEYAKTFFSDRDVHMTTEAERSRKKLQKTFNIQKSLGRSRATQRKQLENRVQEGTVFLEEDFRRGLQIVTDDLEGLVKFYDDTKRRQGMKHAMEKLNCKEIMRKWSINLLLMLIFSAAGQRPQVYTTLPSPDSGEICDMKEQASRIHLFEMRTTVEKTRRKNDFPNVLAHESALKYVDFHCRVARGIIVQRTGVVESQGDLKPLLMHTETGDYLTTAQVTRVLKGFIEYHFSEMTGINIMSLRSSFGTVMMGAYHDQRMFKNLEENEFLAILGKVMNTSVEQLRTTYIGVDRSEFEVAANEFNKVLYPTAGMSNRERMQTENEGRSANDDGNEKEVDVFV